MLKRLEVENAFKNAAIEVSSPSFGLSKEVVPLDYCLSIAKQYFSEEVDERDVKIAKLEAKILVLEDIISKTTYEPIIKVMEGGQDDACMQPRTL